MGWIASKSERRVYNSKTGGELIPEGGGSDMISRFKVSNHSEEYHFNAKMTSPILSMKQREEIGIDKNVEIAVWKIWYTGEKWRKDIKGAMLAYKTSFGFHYPNNSYFVQFGEDGGLESE